MWDESGRVSAHHAPEPLLSGRIPYLKADLQAVDDEFFREEERAGG